MARDLSAQTGIDNSDADYINGKLVDGTTVVGEGINQDIVQFFQGLMDESGLTANGLPDNDTNTYQFIEALKEVVLSREKIQDVAIFEDFVDSVPAGGSKVVDISAFTSDERDLFNRGVLFTVSSDDPGYHRVTPIRVLYDYFSPPLYQVTLYNDTTSNLTGDLCIIKFNANLF